jgi:hypothetical protein
MATQKQTRRSISVRGITYDTLRKYCDSTNRSMSDIVEEQLSKLFSNAPVPARSTVKSAPRARATVAPKIVRAAAPAAPEAVSPTGRPAPKDAREVIPARVDAPQGDYRTINF